MADLTTLIRKRTAAKGWLSRCIGKTHEAMAVEQEADQELLLSLKNDMESRLKAMDELQSEVEVLFTTDEEMMEDIEKAALFRDSVTAVLTNLCKALRQMEQETRPSTGSASGAKAVKLPKIDLPKFSGDVLNWMPFWESFQSAVGSADLPGVRKLTYLRSLLQGEAKRCIEGLPLSGSSYQASCKILEERFGRKELVIFSHVQKLLEVKSSTSGPADDALQRLVDDLLVHIRSLEALGVGGERYGVILTPLILSRVPADVRLEWARDSVGREGDLEFLIKFLQQELDRRGRSGVYRSLSLPGQPPSAGVHPSSSFNRKERPGMAEFSPRRNHHRSATAALQAASTVCCNYCGLQHQTAKCGAWQRLSVADRFGWVREKGLCFCCLQATHLARRCAARCERCGGRHHLTLCGNVGRERGPQREEGGGSAKEGGPTQPVAVAKGGGPQGESVSLSCTTAGGGVTLLPVATVMVPSVDGNSVVQGTLLFDGGADRSFVSKSFRKKVQGEFKGSVEISCASFGGSKRTDVCDIYDLSVTGLNVSVPTAEKLRVVEVDQISAPLRRPPVTPDLLQHFGHLQLAADNSSSDSILHIDLVIGQDQYWSLVKSGLVRSSEGLVAMETAFGWVLSGSVGGQSGMEG